ncbi:hypothetical protein ACKVEX_08875 [Rhodocyclaceae bacterium SMB388]
MQRDPRFDQLFGRLHRQTVEPMTLTQKILAAIVGAGVFALALMFSVVLFAGFVAVGTVAWGYLWWKTRAIRKKMRENPPDVVVIEGEVIREVHEDSEAHRGDGSGAR